MFGEFGFAITYFHMDSYFKKKVASKYDLNS